MSFDRQEWNDLKEKKHKEHLNGQKTHLELMRQQAVHADLLTGDQNWDLFLQYLGAIKEHCEAESDAATQGLKNPELVNVDEIMRLKIASACLEDRVKLIDAIMKLPKDLKTQGKNAKSLLDQLDD